MTPSEASCFCDCNRSATNLNRKNISHHDLGRYPLNLRTSQWQAVLERNEANIYGISPPQARVELSSRLGARENPPRVPLTKLFWPRVRFSDKIDEAQFTVPQSFVGL